MSTKPSVTRYLAFKIQASASTHSAARATMPRTLRRFATMRRADTAPNTPRPNSGASIMGYKSLLRIKGCTAPSSAMRAVVDSARSKTVGLSTRSSIRAEKFCSMA